MLWPAHAVAAFASSNSSKVERRPSPSSKPRASRVLPPPDQQKPADDHYFYDLTISDANNALEASPPELDPRPPDEAYFHDPIFDDW